VTYTSTWLPCAFYLVASDWIKLSIWPSLIAL